MAVRYIKYFRAVNTILADPTIRVSVADIVLAGSVG